MQCRYCHQPAVPADHVCLKCRLLITSGDWDQLAMLELFFHPQHWVTDVSAFVELAEAPVQVAAGSRHSLGARGARGPRCSGRRRP
jgi:hypothetical protein